MQDNNNQTSFSLTSNSQISDEFSGDAKSMYQLAITDDLDQLLSTLPETIRTAISAQSNNHDLLEIVMDLGRQPAARYPDREIRPVSYTHLRAHET